MRYMIFDNLLGFVVKDTTRNHQCVYNRNTLGAGNALRFGIGKSGRETIEAEVMVPVPEISLREANKTLRRALNKAVAELEAELQNEPDSIIIREAVEVGRAALKDTESEA